MRRGKNPAYSQGRQEDVHSRASVPKDPLRPINLSRLTLRGRVRHVSLMMSAIRRQVTRITRKDNRDNTRKIYQTGGSCRSICRDCSSGNVEQFPARKSHWR